MTTGYHALSEKEKQTLRLLLVGYDAKSMARHLTLSVHTVNERLRDARRKMAVSSSREAARLLHEAEAAMPGPAAPDLCGDKALGEAGTAPAMPPLAPAEDGPPPWRVRRFAIGGVLIMSLFLATLALSPLTSSFAPHAAPTPVAHHQPALDAASTRGVDAARQWLVLVDAGQWEASWQATGASFRALNTLAVWSQASDEARVPLGAARNRVLAGTEEVPAPPAGYLLVRFHTDFAQKAGATETLTLAQEDGAWRVTGYIIE